MRFARDIRLRRVICLRACVDLYHITFRVSEKYHVCREGKHITSSEARYITLAARVRIHLPKAQFHLFRIRLPKKKKSRKRLFLFVLFTLLSSFFTFLSVPLRDFFR
jgi:hypothetical protein